MREHGLDDGVGRDALALALEVDDDAVAQGRQRDLLDVVGGQGEATGEQGLDLAREQEGLGAGFQERLKQLLALDAKGGA